MALLGGSVEPAAPRGRWNRGFLTLFRVKTSHRSPENRDFLQVWALVRGLPLQRALLPGRRVIKFNQEALEEK
jgi:hypothetical protein